MFKPVPPKKPYQKYEVFLPNDCSMKEIITLINGRIKDGEIPAHSMDTATIAYTYIPHSDDASLIFRAFSAPDEEAYVLALSLYNKRKAEYDAWYAENKDTLELKQKFDRQQEKAAKILKLQKEIEKLQDGK